MSKNTSNFKYLFVKIILGIGILILLGFGIYGYILKRDDWGWLLFFAFVLIMALMEIEDDTDEEPHD